MGPTKPAQGLLSCLLLVLLLEGSHAFSCKGFTILIIGVSLFRTRCWFQNIASFFVLTCAHTWTPKDWRCILCWYLHRSWTVDNIDQFVISFDEPHCQERFFSFIAGWPCIYTYIHMVLVGVYCMILNFAMFRVYSETRSQAEEHVTILHFWSHSASCHNNRVIYIYIWLPLSVSF